MQGKTTKKTRIFYPYRTPKIPGKEGKNTPKNQGNPSREKKQGIPKNKEKKHREVTKKCPGVRQFLPITGATGKRTFQGGPRFGSVRFGYGLGVERFEAVPVFGSGGSSAKGCFLCKCSVLQYS